MQIAKFLIKFYFHEELHFMKEKITSVSLEPFVCYLHLKKYKPLIIAELCILFTP